MLQSQINANHLAFTCCLRIIPFNFSQYGCVILTIIAFANRHLLDFSLNRSVYFGFHRAYFSWQFDPPSGAPLIKGGWGGSF